MRIYALSAVAIATILLATFAIAELLNVPVLTDATPRLGDAGTAAAAASFALLAGDVLLPVPSSALMVLNGALFGVFGGTLLSMAGSEAAALLGHAIGRGGGSALERHASPAATARVRRLVVERGVLAIIVTRPVPILAETAAILAGATGMRRGRLAAAAAVGSLPPALAYGLVGSHAPRVDAGLAAFAGALLLAAGWWIVARRKDRNRAAR